MSSSRPPTLLSLLAIVLSSTHISHSKPLPRDNAGIEARNTTLEVRCAGTPCGWTGQLCCAAGETCFTDSNNQAQCGTGSGGGGGVNQETNNYGQWQLYTTTYVETDLITRTSTYSSYLGGATSSVAPTQELVPAPTNAICNTGLGEIPCGYLCCAVGQYCLYQGQCTAVGGGGGDFSSYYLSSVTGSAFIRPTSNGVQTITSTGSATTTVPFQTPTSTSGSSTAGMEASTTNNGLSGGAIAGIVIGVLIGLGILFLLCACFCFKGLLDGLLGFFGIGPRRRRREETYIEERHSTRHSGGGGGRAWFGTRPSRVDKPKRSGGWGGFTAVTSGLAALALLLGLKRRRDRRDKDSYGTGSSYTYSDYTSSSKFISFLQS